MTALPISAVLITYEAERHLDRVLDGLEVCDEIVVLDSGSNDRTREIAAAHGAAWHEHPFDGFGPQKRRATALARHDWVLSVDADEVLDTQAQNALRGLPWSALDPADCWRLCRRPFIGAREIRHGHWLPDRVVRLFNRQVHGFSAAAVHESVTPTGPVHDLAGSVLHFSYPDLAALFRADYHRLKAARYRAAGRSAGQGQLVARAAAVLLRSYVLRRGFLDGPAGVVVALAGAVSAVTGLAMASDDASGSAPSGKP
jgi:glycosyltransferase involved in cell wall biosynthesis